MLQIFTDRRCLEHHVPAGMPEIPRRLQGILDRLAECDWPLDFQPPEIDIETLAGTVHHPAYIGRLRRAVERGDGLIDSADNPLSAHTWEAASGALAAAIAAADWSRREPQRCAFAAIRPPGHHAEYDTAMGFCYLNNIAITAQYLIERHGCEKVAIVDFDVHHGNGTQHLFEERPDVLFISLHQFPFYPGTGAASETGRGRGEGATLNVPLPAGSGDTIYERAFRDQVLPALDAFAPQALLISAGFDAWQDDPLGGMKVSAEAYRHWGGWLRELADEHCAGRVLALLEGGYDLAALPELTVRFLTGLDGPPASTRSARTA